MVEEDTYDFLSDFSDGSRIEEILDTECLNEAYVEKPSKVRYGKSFLKKGTPEYQKWRERNNNSIINSRLKKKKIEDDRKRKLEELKAENKEMIENQIQIYSEIKCLQKFYSELYKGKQIPIDLGIFDKMHEELLSLKNEYSLKNEENDKKVN